MVRLDRSALAGDCQSLHHVMKFPYVAGPIVSLEQCQRLGSDALNAASTMFSRVLEKGFQDGCNVVRPCAERWEAKLIHVQSIEQVEAKAAGLDLSRQVFVGGRDDADVHFDAVRIAEGIDDVIFQDAEQFGLCRKAHLTDFVEEERPTGSELELARFRVFGIREGTALIAEEF